MIAIMRRPLLLGALALAVLIAGLYFGRSKEPEIPTRIAGGSGRHASPQLGAAQRAGRPAAMPWFAQTGVPARRVAGKVTFEGKPVAGAEVRLTSQVSDLGLAPEDIVSTDAGGGFDFGPQLAQPHGVYASAPDRTPAQVEIDLRDPGATPAPDHLELVLRRCDTALSGHVTDASGNGIAKARLSFGGGRTETDAAGAYRMCVKRGMTLLSVEADSYGSIDLRLTVLASTKQDVVLVPEAVVSGKVIRDDGTPVAQAVVNVWTPRNGFDGPHTISTATDATGHFRAAGVNPGEVGIGALADGLASESLVRASVVAGQANPEVTIRVTAMVRIKGKVVMAGAPVAGAHVRTTLRAPTRYSPEVVTQRDGTFLLDRVWRGDNIFTVTPYEVMSPKSVIAAGHGEDVTIEVSALGAVRGRVSRHGQPVADAMVQVSGSGNSAAATSASDGTYEIKGLRPGKLTVFTQSYGEGAFDLPVPVTLAAGEHKDGVDLDLKFAGAISGTVVDQDGKPVEGAYVRFIQPSGDIGEGTTDAAGAFTCGSMTGNADYTPSVLPSRAIDHPLPWIGGPPKPVHVADGDAHVEGIKLQVRRDNLALSGHVVDQAGAPIADARVRTQPVATSGDTLFSSWVQYPSAVTDADGAFTLTGLAAGAYAISAHASDGSEAMVPSVAAGSKDVTVKVLRAGGIDGTLVGFSAQPAVYAQHDKDSHFVGAQIDGATFKLRGLPPGPYTVTAQSDTDGDATHVEIKPGENAAVTLTSHGHARIDGTVVAFGTGAPVPGVHVCRAILHVGNQVGLTNWDPSTLPHPDAAGHFTLDPAPAGEVSAHCYDFGGDYSDGAAPTSVASGGHADVKMMVVKHTLTGDQNGGWSGLELDYNAELGARISRVAPGTAAAKAGVAPGDSITAVDGAAVAGLTPGGVGMLIENHPIGSTCNLTVAHGGGTLTVAIPMQAM